jgi:DDE superfamily endonuclease
VIAQERDEAARAAWREAMAAVDPTQVVFVDETSTPITLTPLRARAPRGQRAIGRVPRGKRPHISWLATLTADGLGESLVIQGAVDGQVCDRFVAEVLVPSLRPGQIVLWDQLNVHKSTRARTLIEQAGCRVVFLPSYSPDFNPIEHAFAKAKQALRRLEARSWESIVAAIGQVLPTITTADARAFFAAAGFPLPDTT